MVAFAAKKLIWCDPLPSEYTFPHELAILSARLPIELMSSGVLPDSTKEEEMNQITNHMRICMSIDDSFHKITSLNPSEPIVSDAAYFLMNRQNLKAPFNAPKVLLAVLDGVAVHRGDRGELVALLALTMARDRAAERSKNSVIGVVSFLKELIAVRPVPNERFVDIMKIKPSVYKDSSDRNVPLEEAFAEIRVYFNHFIKRRQQDFLDESVLREFIARCAAVMGANGEEGWDVVIPSVSGPPETLVVRGTMGLIMVQVKNDPRYSATVSIPLFDRMDPVAMGFIDRDESLETPIIRMVLALAGTKPAIDYVRTQNPGKFTAYDIWISGLSPKTFGLIDEVSHGTWTSLLSASPRKGWKEMYDLRKQSLATKMKQQYPLAANDPAFRTFGQRKLPSD
ncbi:hypothetical protein EUX98_g9055 [Antrodiella citrinella]|uniref:Uncharacterized protein n=1 Tax=Antrodiella citrinella TaxID=2447956 RepID=A0A4S4LYX9_9APHY|nr:hypothetical protein EUX98_g9055 [Antrodiella citrinella]